MSDVTHQQGFAHAMARMHMWLSGDDPELLDDYPQCRPIWVWCLAHNLAIGGALCRAYNLGRASCWCDRGPIGNEWYPGMGCPPENIAERRWNDDPHEFSDDGSGECSACGRKEHWFLHEQCPECFAIPSENDGEHGPGCGKAAP